MQIGNVVPLGSHLWIGSSTVSQMFRSKLWLAVPSYLSNHGFGFRV